MASTRDDYESLYLRYLELCNAHDFDGMTAFYTPTIKVNDAPMAPDSVVTQFAPLVAGFPDWKWRYAAFSSTATSSHCTSGWEEPTWAPSAGSRRPAAG